MTKPVKTSKLERDFDAVMKQWRADHGAEPAANPTGDWLSYWRARALHACWWFIENVDAGDPGRNDIFFKVRVFVREAQEV